MKKKYYIYTHIDPRTTLPFYIGKGSGDRAYQMGKARRNPKHFAQIEEIRAEGLEPMVQIGNRFASEKECYEVEIKEVAFFRKIGVDIKNIGDGGEGVRLTPELIRQRSDKLKKPIVCIDSDVVYTSTLDCSRELNISPSSINDVLKGRKRSCGGYRFKYADEALNTVANTANLNRQNGIKGHRVECLDDQSTYKSMSQLANEIGLNVSYLCRKWNNDKIITVRGKKYRKL